MLCPSYFILFVCLQDVLVFIFSVVFKLKPSKRSNNGTDVGSGQIPEILYRVPMEEKDSGLHVQLLDKMFSTSVSAVRTLLKHHLS